MNGDELVASHLPNTRIAERTHASGTFWLPEEDSDTIPSRVRQMQVMAAAPKLLAALKTVVDMENDRDEESRNFDEERLQYFASLIAEATGRAA